MAKKAKIKMLTWGKKHPQPSDIMHDMRAIGRKFGISYLKDFDPFSDYFAEKLAVIRSCYKENPSAYYYATRLESLAYRHERARKYYAERKHLKAVG